jgi:hypothetical protein
MANECIPLFERSLLRVAAKASAGLTGKRFCAISADAEAGYGIKGLAADPLVGSSRIIVGAPTAAVKNLGVCEKDVASGGEVNVLIGGRGAIVPSPRRTRRSPPARRSRSPTPPGA